MPSRAVHVLAHRWSAPPMSCNPGTPLIPERLTCPGCDTTYRATISVIWEKAPKKHHQIQQGLLICRSHCCHNCITMMPPSYFISNSLTLVGLLNVACSASANLGWSSPDFDIPITSIYFSIRRPSFRLFSNSCRDSTLPSNNDALLPYQSYPIEA